MDRLSHAVPKTQEARQVLVTPISDVRSQKVAAIA